MSSLLVMFPALLSAITAQTIPKELWGRWVVRRELPTSTISCWGEQDAKSLIGTKVEYSARLFRWKGVATKNPTAEIKIVTAEQFHDDNSGKGSNSSQVTFRQLGIKDNKVAQVRIRHPDAEIAGATIEVPGDSVLLKDKNTIIFSFCNIYFEAVRMVVPLRN